MREVYNTMSTRKVIGASLIALIVATGMVRAAVPSLPAGGTFTAGSGSFSTSGSSETVTVAPEADPVAPPAVINWSGGYDVAAGKTVTYQAGSGQGTLPSVVVNNDTSGSASAINGTITSPGFAQVIVNPDGISVGPNAVLPGSIAMAAGTYVPSTGDVTATNSPITIAPGVSFKPLSSAVQPFSSVTIDAVSGDTLPETHGTTAVIAVPDASTTSVTQKFSLYQNQSFTGQFLSQQNGTPAPVSIDGGSASGVSVSSLDAGTANNGSITVENVDATGSVVVGANPDGENFASTGTTTIGSLSAAGNGAAGGVTVSEIGPVNIVGDLSATGRDGGVLVATESGSPANPPGQPGSTLIIAPGLALAASDGQVDLAGETVSLPASVTISGTSFQIASNNPLAGATGGTTINATESGGQFASGMPELSAPSVSGLVVNGTSNQMIFGVQANSASNSTFNVPDISFSSASYEQNPTLYDGATLSLSNLKLAGQDGTGTPGYLSVAGISGVSLANVSEAAPSAGETPSFAISGQPGVKISSSVLYGAGTVSAGIASFSPKAVAGQIDIETSSISSSAGTDIFTALDGGTIDIGTGSTVSINTASTCDGTPGCSTYLVAGQIGFEAGNTITASGENAYTGAPAGTPSANPGETSIQSDTFFPAGGSIQLLTASQGATVAGGNIDIAGTLDAGSPAVPVTNPTPPPSNTPSPPPPSNTGGTTPVAPHPGNGGGKATTTPSAPPAATRPTAAKPTVAPQVVVSLPVVEISPSTAVSTVEQRGSTVLVPEAPERSGPAVTIDTNAKKRGR